MNQVFGTLADGAADAIKALGSSGAVKAGSKLEVAGTIVSAGNIGVATVDTVFSRNAREYSETFSRQIRTSIGAVAGAVSGSEAVAAAGSVGVALAPVTGGVSLVAAAVAAPFLGVAAAYYGSWGATSAYDRAASSGVKSMSRSWYDWVGSFGK